MQYQFPTIECYGLDEQNKSIFNDHGERLTESERKAVDARKRFSGSPCDPVFVGVSAPDYKLPKISVPGVLAHSVINSILSGLLERSNSASNDASDAPWYAEIQLIRLDLRFESSFIIENIAQSIDILKNSFEKASTMGEKSGHTFYLFKGSTHRQYKLYSYVLPEDLKERIQRGGNVVLELSLRKDKLKSSLLGEDLLSGNAIQFHKKCWEYFTSDVKKHFKVAKDLNYMKPFSWLLCEESASSYMKPETPSFRVPNSVELRANLQDNKTPIKLVNWEGFPVLLSVVYLCFLKNINLEQEEIQVHLNANDLIECLGLNVNQRSIKSLRDNLSALEKLSVEIRTTSGDYVYYPLVLERVLSPNSKDHNISSKTYVTYRLSGKCLSGLLMNTRKLPNDFFKKVIQAYNVEHKIDVKNKRNRLPDYFFPCIFNALSLEHSDVEYLGFQPKAQTRMEAFLLFLFDYLYKENYLPGETTKLGRGKYALNAGDKTNLLTLPPRLE
jgi:hypothetical protein